MHINIQTLHTDIDNTPEIVLIALADGLFVGMLIIREIETEKPVITDIFVDEQYRHKGIASLLISVAMDICHKKKEVWLFVSPENKEAQSVYKKAGFEQTNFTTEWGSIGMVKINRER